jgi:predicted molibdopterin-dependent oxidoreductase YjgC
VLVTDDPATASRVQATHVYLLPVTPNGRGIADAWSAAGDDEPAETRPLLLVISGDEAAVDPSVRAMAAEADTVIGIGMFEESFRGIADLVLPGTSYLERDGTTVNLEGRLQRQRRAVLAAVPDVLAWVAKLGERFGVEISPYAPVVFDELATTCYGGVTYGEIGEHSPLLPKAATAPTPAKEPAAKAAGTGLRLVAYRPLFSGPAVDRTPELQFQRPDAIAELAPDDAKARGIRNGQAVTLSANGTSVELRARIARDLPAGAVRVASNHAADLHAIVEIRAS